MIILHCKRDDPFAAKIEEVLKTLVVAYKIRVYETPESVPSVPGTELPFIRESNLVISGREQIEDYLNQLTAELRQQRSVTGDGCYIDPRSGEVC